MKHRFERLISFAACVAAFMPLSFVHAQMPEVKLPVIEKIPGQPVRVKWEDGRVAILRGYYGHKYPVKVPYKITESTCRPIAPVNCEHSYEIIKGKVLAQWEKHPDPSRAGQWLKAKMNNLILHTEALYGRGHLPLYPQPTALQSLARQALTCPDFSWTGLSAPTEVMVQNWENEIMIVNPETGVSENRSISGHMNVVLKSVSPQVMEIANEGIVTSEFIPVVGLTAAQNLTLQTTEGGNCLVAASSRDVPANLFSPEPLDPELMKNTLIWMTDSKEPLFYSPSYGPEEQMIALLMAPEFAE